MSGHADPQFKSELSAVIPALRAFARSLCGNQSLSDDLVQETLLKAWTSRGTFQEGRSLKSWTFTILHNTFHSQWRKSRHLVPLDAADPANTIRPVGAEDSAMDLADVSRLLRKLPLDQQEALVLIAAGGFSYGEAARITGAAIGTIKSRVSRARAALALAMEHVD